MNQIETEPLKGAGEERMYVIPKKINEDLLGDPWGRGSAIKSKGFVPVQVPDSFLRIWAKDLGEQGLLRINYSAATTKMVYPDGLRHEAFTTPTHYSIEMVDRNGHRVRMPREFFTEYVDKQLQDIFEAATPVKPNSME